MNRLEEAYRQLGEDSPVFGDAERAIGTVRRRRGVAYAGGSLLVALMVIGGMLLGNLLPRDPEPAGAPPAFRIDEWARPTSPTNSGAEAGTLLYQACVKDNHCPVYLRRADGKEVALAQVRPDLATVLEKRGMTQSTNISLSYDARWLGIGIGRRYGIYRLDDPSRVFTLPSAPKGTAWQVVDWGTTSREVAVAAIEGNRVRRYAWVSLAGAGGVELYTPAKQWEYQPPERMAEGGVVVGNSVAPGHPGVTELSTTVLKLTGPAKGTDGSWWTGTTLPDVKRYLRPGETLAGPEDGLVEWSVPPADGALTSSVVVWSGGRVTAVLEGGVGSDGAWHGTRIDVPAGEEWSYVGPLPNGAIAVRHDERPEQLVAVHADGRRQRITTLKKDAAILLPGMPLPF